MFNMRDIRCKARPHNLVLAGVWEAILRDVVVGHGHKRPRSPPLVTLTIRKGLCLFLLYACMRSCYCSYGDSLGDPRFQCEAYRVNYGNLQWSSCALRLYGLPRSTKTSRKLLTYDRIKIVQENALLWIELIGELLRTMLNHNQILLSDFFLYFLPV